MVTSQLVQMLCVHICDSPDLKTNINIGTLYRRTFVIVWLGVKILYSIFQWKPPYMYIVVEVFGIT